MSNICSCISVFSLTAETLKTPSDVSSNLLDPRGFPQTSQMHLHTTAQNLQHQHLSSSSDSTPQLFQHRQHGFRETQTQNILFNNKLGRAGWSLWNTKQLWYSHKQLTWRPALRLSVHTQSEYQEAGGGGQSETLDSTKAVSASFCPYVPPTLLQNHQYPCSPEENTGVKWGEDGGWRTDINLILQWGGAVKWDLTVCTLYRTNSPR